MDPFPEYLNDLIRDSISRENLIIEQYTVQATQGGKHGVKIVRKDGIMVEIGVSEEVPFGEIHEHYMS